jgi:transcriptional regulator with XRE-family HTH domain
MRRRAGMTQFELSEKLGYLSHSEVSKVERGERFPDLLLYVRWCRACNVDVVTSIANLISDGL